MERRKIAGKIMDIYHSYYDYFYDKDHEKIIVNLISKNDEELEQYLADLEDWVSDINDKH